VYTLIPTVCKISV